MNVKIPQTNVAGPDTLANGVDGTQPFIQLRDVSKQYGHTLALNKVSIDVYPGKVIGLMGGNGAGKSTMMRILLGVNDISSGTLTIAGVERTTSNYNASVAKGLGVAGVYQELSLASNLRVYENFYVKDKNQYKGFAWRKEAQRLARERINAVFPNMGIDVTDSVETLSLAQRQMVEIVIAGENPELKLLILDEPTSSLSAERTEQLHQFVKQLKERNVAVVYISHKLREVLDVVDEIVVMRNGNKVWSGATTDVSEEDLVGYMGGGSESQGDGSSLEREAQLNKREAQGTNPKVVLRNYYSPTLRNVTFEGMPGEIIGVSGLEGSGQQELLKAIFNRQRPRKGTLDASARVAYVSGNRAAEGVFPFWSIQDNIGVSSFFRLSRFGLIQAQKIRELAEHWFVALKFRANGIHESITALSGGNQQKALIARALGSDAEIVLLDDPTRGVDVQTKQDIYALLVEAAEVGRTIIWYSTEDKEMEYCNRVYVMRRGQVVRQLKDDQVTESEVIAASYIEPETGSESGIAVETTTARTRLFAGIFTQRWVLPAISFVLILAAIGVFNTSALSSFGLTLLFESAVPLVLVALGQMFVILSGGIDLGIGAFVGLVNVITATILIKNPVEGTLLLLLLIAAYGVMGSVIYIRRIPAIVVTLGASFIWLGIALTIQSTPGGSVPKWLGNFYGINIPVIPEPIILAIIFGFIGYFILRRSRYGVILRAFGNNPDAVIKAGWSGLRAQVTLYVLAGALATLGGLAVTAVNSGSDANASSAYQLLSIASVILGGSEFIGGIVEPVGVVIGALTFSLIGSLLGFLNIGSNFEPGLQGLLLILVLASRILSSRGVKTS